MSRSSATTALVVTTGLVALVGCATSGDALDAPIDWSTVDGSPDESACGVPAGDQSPPTTPPSVTWQQREGVELPVSPALGPADTSVLNRCYAHSPSGALLAAVGLRADEIRHGNGTVIADRAARTDERLSALVDGEIPEVSDLPPDATGELIGYRFESARDDDVTVSLAWASTTSGGSTSARIRLVWEDQDWQVVMQPSNGMWSTIAVDDPLDGFVRWGGSPGDSTDA